MLEYQGWITIREAFNEADENPQRLAGALQEINAIVSEIREPNLQINLSAFNGSSRLSILGACNRKDSRWDSVTDLFEKIAEIAPGSYGVLSFWDDEDAGVKSNSYQLYVMKKGTVSLHVDPFLSPCVPELEER